MQTKELRERRRAADASECVRRVGRLLEAAGEPALGPTEAAGAHKSFMAGASVESVLVSFRILRKLDAEHAAKKAAQS